MPPDSVHEGKWKSTNKNPFYSLLKKILGERLAFSKAFEGKTLDDHP